MLSYQTNQLQLYFFNYVVSKSQLTLVIIKLTQYSLHEAEASEVGEVT